MRDFKENFGDFRWIQKIIGNACAILGESLLMLRAFEGNLRYFKSNDLNWFRDNMGSLRKFEHLKGLRGISCVLVEFSRDPRKNKWDLNKKIKRY